MAETTTPTWAPSKMTPIRSWVAHGLRCALVRAPLYGAINGYVQVPSMTQEQADQVDVHGGVTFGVTGDGWIGFDTLHSGDVWPDAPDYWSGTSWDRHWDEEKVAAECERMAASAKAVFEPKPHSEWGWTDWWTEALCRAVGCGSVVHPWRGIGYRFVCNPLHLWLFDRDERKEVRRG